MSDTKARLDRLNKALAEHCAKADYPMFGSDKRIGQKIDKPKEPASPAKPATSKISTGSQEFYNKIQAAKQGIASPGITPTKKKG